MRIPLVSIIVTTYKRPDYLDKCLNSIRAQDFTDYEILIVDDNPMSVSEGIVHKYRSIFNIGERYRYLKNARNLGYPNSLNKALSLAKGKYVAVLDDDDVWLDRNKLNLQVDFLESRSDYVLVGTGKINVNIHGDEIGRTMYPETDEELKNIMLGQNNFAHSSVLYSAIAAQSVGGYVIPEWHYYSEDEILWIKLGTKGKVANLPIYGLQYNSHNRGAKYNFWYALIPAIRQLIIIYKYKYEYPNYTRALIVKLRTIIRCLIGIILDIPPFSNVKNYFKIKYPGVWLIISKK